MAFPHIHIFVSKEEPLFKYFILRGETVRWWRWCDEKEEEEAGLTIDWLREECLDGMGGIRQLNGLHLYFPHIPTSDTKIDKSFSIPI